ncbi:MAG TPA: hypothetical protein VIH52_01540 [Candidatus Nanoarchaeia archaeon]|nr:hypothetical protein [uncultured archaeon]
MQVSETEATATNTQEDFSAAEGVFVTIFLLALAIVGIVVSTFLRSHDLVIHSYNGWQFAVLLSVLIPFFLGSCVICGVIDDYQLKTGKSEAVAGLFVLGFALAVVSIWAWALGAPDILGATPIGAGVVLWIAAAPLTA